MTVGIIVQARCNSSRLPGKVMAPICGRPMLALLMERMAHVQMADRIMVATTDRSADDGIASLGWDTFRGSENDVLDRYNRAAWSRRIDTIVRVTADTPLIDPATVDMLIARFAMGDCDHVEIGGMPDGCGAEVISRETLEHIAAQRDLTAEDREHVTLYARRRPAQFRLARIETGLGMDRERWSVDFPADLEFVRRIYETLYPMDPEFTFGDIDRLLLANPDLREINAGPLGPIDTELFNAVQARRMAPSFAPLLGDL